MWIFPVALGAGKRLFGDGTINPYARAGQIEIGEMDFEEPTEAELEPRQGLAAG
jgi:hypothetical protein